MVSERGVEINIDLGEAQNFLGDLSIRAGDKLKGFFKNGGFSSEEKEGVDFTTQADKEVDELIKELISKRYPTHQFLTEETAPPDYSDLESAESLWIVDPLDGTINFSRGRTNFAISIAYMSQGTIILCAVYIPMFEQFYTARHDVEGAYLNEGRIHVSQKTELREITLGTDWGWDLAKRDNILEWLQKFAKKIRQIQSLGSAVADLAALAEGKSDIYFHSGIKPWDVAASGFLVQKAGGRVTDVDGSEWSPFKKEILATNGRLHQAALDLLGPHPIKH